MKSIIKSVGRSVIYTSVNRSFLKSVHKRYIKMKLSQ